MLKKINRVLKLVGLNLVRAKRKSPKSEAKRVKDAISEFLNDPRPPYTREELENCPPNPAWKTQNDGKTHYVGDDCPGGHTSGYVKCGTENCCIGSEAKVFVGNPNANFVPVDIGVDDHEMTRVEHWETSGGTTPEQNEARFEKPRVEQPTSDNKITGTSS